MRRGSIQVGARCAADHVRLPLPGLPDVERQRVQRLGDDLRGADFLHRQFGLLMDVLVESLELGE